MGVRSASGSATLTRLLELAAARSGTGDVHMALLAHGTPHLQGLRVMGHHPQVAVLHEYLSTNCLLRAQYCPLEIQFSLTSDNSFRDDAMSM